MEEKLDADNLQKLVNEGYNLTEIAEKYEVSPSWVSQLAKKYKIEGVPKPGHRRGVPLSEETRDKISDTILKK